MEEYQASWRVAMSGSQCRPGLHAWAGLCRAPHLKPPALRSHLQYNYLMPKAWDNDDTFFYFRWGAVMSVL